MNAFYAWAQLHPAIVIVAAVVGFGAQLYYRVKRQRAFSRRISQLDAKTAEQRGHELTQQSAWRRVQNGAKITLIFPGAFSILIWGLYVFGGRILTDNAGVNTDMLVLSIAYPVGSMIMGVVIGLGLPLMRNFFVSTLVGMVAVAPFVIGIALSMDNALTQWGSVDTILAALMIVFFGAALGHGATTIKRRRRATGTAKADR